MVSFNQLVLGFFIVQIYVNAAPSDTTEIPTTVSTSASEQQKTEEQSVPLEINVHDSAQSQRQKRYYNFNEFPPLNPYYPTYNKRIHYRDTSVYGIDDPLTQIHRQLAEIASAARHPIPPPLPINFPFYLPVIYVPQYGCNCNPQQQPTPGPQQNQTSDPGIENRFPVLEDDRQNWGLVNNDTEEDYDENEDFSRPISFDPIMIDRPMKRPPPPVEHGSTQGGQGGPPSTTTVRPAPASPTAPPRDPSKNSPINPPSNQGPFAAPYPGNFAPPEAPSICDGAVISCCHQAQVTYSCFALQGCPDPTFYGNPCDPLVILRVIDKYQRFYGRRNG